jgi:hypothetical protein
VPDTCNEYKIGFHVKVENIGAILIVDEFEGSLNPFVYKNLSNDTDWTPYTPTYTNLGTISNNSAYWRQVGDSIEVQAWFSTVSVPASLPSMTLPMGLNIDSAKLPRNNTTAAMADSIGEFQTSVTGANDSTGKVMTAPATSTSLIYFSYKDGSAGTNHLIPTPNAQGIFGSGSISIRFKVPIAGWKATTEHVITPAKSTVQHHSISQANNALLDRIGNYRYNLATATITDTGGGIVDVTDDLTDTRWTAKQTSTFIINVSAFVEAAAERIRILKNGIEIHGGQSAHTIDSGALNSLTIPMNRDDYITINGATGTGLRNSAAPLRVYITALLSDISFLAAIPTQKTAYIKDIKSSGVSGGTFTSGAWQTRDLNTLSGNIDFITNTSNQFTLIKGEYELEAEAPAANGVGGHKIRLRNITDSTDEAIGTSGQNRTNSIVDGTRFMTTLSKLKCKLELTETKTFEIQHRSTATYGGNGFGVALGFGVDEVYTQVKITKVR